MPALIRTNKFSNHENIQINIIAYNQINRIGIHQIENYLQRVFYFTFYNKIKMTKLIVKSGSTVKLFSGKMQFAALADFLKASFTAWTENNLFYTDKDGDRIHLTSQEDFDVLLELAQNQKFIKLQVLDQTGKETKNQIQKQNNESPQFFEVKKEVNLQKKQIAEDHREPTHYENKNSQFVQIRQQLNFNNEKKQKISQKPDLGFIGLHPWMKYQKSSRKQVKNESFCSPKLQKFQKLFNCKITEIVDERIKSLVPCIKNQLSQHFQPLSSEYSEDIIHKNIECKGCGVNPVHGIRYKCLECPNFNLCAVCEDKIQHNHNLLKMKKPEVKQSEKSTNSLDLNHLVGKLVKKVVKFIDDKGNTSQNHGCWRKERFTSTYCHQGRKDQKFQRRMNKLKQIFGEKVDYTEFIEKTFDLKCQQMIKKYAQQQQIDNGQFNEKCNKLKKMRLAAFYDSPEQEFNDIVQKNPEMNFRAIIQELKRIGQRTHTGENFQRMRKKMKQELSRMNLNSEIKKEEPLNNKPENKEKKIECTVKDSKIITQQQNKMTKGQEMKTKGKIHQEMKQLFGEDRGREIFKFIEDNFALGKEGIIGKWLDEKV